jgi:predicted N-acyltransferase
MRVEVAESLAGVAAAEWDAMVGRDDPFTEHAFLVALERSGCVGAQAGWLPCHLLARDGARLVGAMPLYLKDNSFGEFIFDWAWAEAAAGTGLDYYPKLVSAVPFTPVTGRRLLVAPGADTSAVSGALLEGAMGLADAADASSLHVLFITEEERGTLTGSHPDLLPRLSYQFHWANRGYRDFEGFISAFRAPERKKVRRERRRASASGLELVTLRGEELEDRHWQALHRFYRSTNARKWGPAYLTEGFFDEVRRHLAHRVVVTMALTAAGEPVAGTLCFQKGHHLHGRYWGCLERHDSLHFELCYHRPVELCIENGWTRFEAGAQGLHKLKRGLMPAFTHSVHWLRHPGLRRAVASFLSRDGARGGGAGGPRSVSAVAASG